MDLLSALKSASAVNITQKVVKKNEYLLRPGMVERNIYLVESGALRIVYLTEFEEHTIRLGYKNSLITSLSSFLKDQPSEFYIQAIRKTKLSVIRKTDFVTFVQQDQNWQLQYQAILEDLVVQQMEREIDLLTFSPVERLKRVLERSPQLFQEIPAKYIASYLRMTPETLSRLRNS
ncbi:MAG: Crp/Fnr family transcriptional regulator [Saprospiraceae bacterium]|nr:MAG: Crp/Fnr family transcriptional regulator [Saprospiraceae bacterium]